MGGEGDEGRCSIFLSSIVCIDCDAAGDEGCVSPEVPTLGAVL